MPFVSKKQMKLCFALQRQNKNKSWNCQEWAEKTDYSKLPIYVPTKSKERSSLSSSSSMIPPSLSKKSRSRSKELRSLPPSLSKKSKKNRNRSRSRSRY